MGVQSATLAVTTAKPASCITTTCPAYTADYSMTVPPANPTMGAFAAATYTVEAQAFVPQSGGTLDCTPSKIVTASISVAAGVPTSAPLIAFVGCQ